MTIVAASISAKQIALATDGLVMQGESVATRNNVKVMPVFQRFAVAWAGLEGLIDEDRFEWTGPDTPPIDRRAPDTPASERDPINLEGRVRIAEIVSEAEKRVESKEHPSTCADVLRAVMPSLSPRLAQTAAYQSELPTLWLFVAGWDADDGLGYVLQGRCAVTPVGNETFRAKIEAEPVATSRKSGAAVLHQPRDLQLADPSTDIPFQAADVVGKAQRLVALVCEEHRAAGLLEEAGGVGRCVAVTPVEAVASSTQDLDG